MEFAASHPAHDQQGFLALRAKYPVSIVRRRVASTLAAIPASADGRLSHAKYLHEIGKAGDERRSGNVRVAIARLSSLLSLIQALPKEAQDGPGSFSHCRTLEELANSLGVVGQFEAALASFGEALVLLEALLEQQPENRNLRIEHAALLSDLGDVLSNQGQYAQAQAHYEQALKEQRAIQDTSNEAATLGQLGTLAMLQLDYPQARLRYQQALEQFREMGNPTQQAVAWHLLVWLQRSSRSGRRLNAAIARA